jgi:hypothetical protein
MAIDRPNRQKQLGAIGSVLGRPTRRTKLRHRHPEEKRPLSSWTMEALRGIRQRVRQDWLITAVAISLRHGDGVGLKMPGESSAALTAAQFPCLRLPQRSRLLQPERFLPCFR